MNKKFQIVIIGAGNAGISVAAQLLRKNSGLNIALIDPSEYHYYQPAYTLVAAGVFDINKTKKFQKDYIPQNTTWIKDTVTEFKPDTNSIVCGNGDEINYDIMIVAPGIQLDWSKIKGSKEAIFNNPKVTSNYLFELPTKTWQMIQDFKGGVAVFTNPNTPIKCGGAPHKIMYLAVDYWRKKGILDKCQVHYISGAGVLFGIKEYLGALEKTVAEGNIHTHFGSNVVEINSSNNTVVYETKADKEVLDNEVKQFGGACYGITEQADEQIKKVEIAFDFCHVVPPQSAPDFVKNSALADPKNPHGYVEVDMYTLQHSRYSNVFSLGDVINAPCSKTGAAIRKQAPVVVDNILSYMKNEALVAKYSGYSACPIPTKFGRLLLAEFDYTNKPAMSFPINQTKPWWVMWILKLKILPWLYWNRILKGTA
jgi:sulfide:quinone oxidoreductase